MIDPKLIDILRCPAGGGRLSRADETLVLRVNTAIQQGQLRDRQDQRVGEEIDEGLVDEKGEFLYPVRAGIATLVAADAIQLSW